MNTLAEWTGQACARLGIDPAAMDQSAVLDLARDVAHGVARPAAPLAAYLLGVAVGQGQPVTQAAAVLRDLAEQWSETATEDAAPGPA